MAQRYVCKGELRRGLVEKHPTINGIDYLEVLDAEALELRDQREGPPERQQTLWVRFFKPPELSSGEPPNQTVAPITADHLHIEGGVRLKDVKVTRVFRMDQVPADPTLTTAKERQEYAGRDDAAHWLVVRTDSPGDFSTYTLSVRRSVSDPLPPRLFDPLLSRVDFSFKVECPSEFDCAPPKVGSPPVGEDPSLDYLTRDFSSFRRLLLDRLTEVAPQWKERNAADLGVALVELMAYTADYLSYYQDAVATEAYLGTARRRTSVRRHARMLDYPMHDGCNARAWVAVRIGPDAEGIVLSGPREDGQPGTMLLTRTSASQRVLPGRQHLELAVTEGAEVFEALHSLTLREAHNRIRFYNWGEDRCCLAKGATSATLCSTNGKGVPTLAVAPLTVGQVLILEEVRSPDTFLAADADPARRHAVRLTRVEPTKDPLLDDTEVVEIEWAVEDALPFELCLMEVPRPKGEPIEAPDQADELTPVTVARGNVMLVDHGRTIDERLKPLVPVEGRFHPRLARGPLTHAARADDHRTVDPTTPASAAFRWSMEQVLPSIRLVEAVSRRVWSPRRTLLNSGRFSREFVAEVEDDGRARLRFGDNVLGGRPMAGTEMKAVYRIGNGNAGNVGADSIAHLYVPPPKVEPPQPELPQDWYGSILSVRNPLPARGGTDPEAVERVRIDAPQAFRVQQRAVSEEDYAEVAQRHPEVQRAVGSLRWTGSWHTMFVTVDRRGGYPVDAQFAEQMAMFMERFRLAGYDVRIEGPLFVPLEIVLTVCVAPGYLASNVKSALLDVFSSRDLPDGRRGFFHPDNFTFGQPVYLSRIVAAAMSVAGVEWVDTEEQGTANRFRRWGKESLGERDAGLIEMDRLEIARLDNDPSQPEHGKIDFLMQGGL